MRPEGAEGAHVEHEGEEAVRYHWVLIREAQRRNKGYILFVDGFDYAGVTIATWRHSERVGAQ